MILMEKHNHRVVFSVMCKNNMLKLILCTFAEAYTGNLLITRQKLGKNIKAKILTTQYQAVRISLCASDRTCDA